MDILEDALNEAIAAHSRPERLLALFISAKLRANGHSPSDNDIKKLEEVYFSLLAGNESTQLELDCAAEGSFTVNDVEVAQFLQAVPKAIGGAVTNTVEALTQSVVSTLDSEAIADSVRLRQDELQGELRTIWGVAFDDLLTLIQLSAELCDSANTAGRAKLRNKSYIDAITRLHARACLISREILLLLENGLSQGAHARWRALHEVTVIAMFIAKYKNPAAVRYLASATIESKRHMDSYERHMVPLGEPPLPSAEQRRINRAASSVVKKFGKPISDGDYGWAAPFVKKPRAKLSDLEADIDLEHYRPWYKVASMYVHGSAHGLLRPMGLLTEPHFEIVPEIALHTVNSLLILNSIILGIAVNVDRLVTAKVLMTHGDAVRDSIGEAASELDEILQAEVSA